MPDQSRPPDKQQPLGRTTDFLDESRYEFIAKLAYKLWEQRGRPFGSPDVDWFAAEQAVYPSLRDDARAYSTVIESPNLRLKKMPLNNGAGYMPALGFGTLIPDTALTK